MRRLLVLSVACVLAVAGMPSAQGDALKTAADALGAANVKTLGFAGSGANFSLGQNFTPNDPWPRVPVTTYTALINFDTGSMRTEILREMGDDDAARRRRAVLRSAASEPAGERQLRLERAGSESAPRWRRTRGPARWGAAGGSARGASGGTRSGQPGRADAVHLVDAAGLRQGRDGQQRDAEGGRGRDRSVVHGRAASTR